MIDIKDFRNTGNEHDKRNLKKPAFFISILIALALIYSGGKIFFDYIEIKEIGENYTSVFFTNLYAMLSIRAISFVVVFVSLALSILFVRKNIRSLGLDRGIIETKRVSFLISFLVAILAGSAISTSLYENLLAFLNPQWFGKADPVFGKDIGYYVFQRPFLMSITNSFLSVWFFLSLFVFVLYWFLCSVKGGHSARELFSFRGIASHNYINAAILLILYCLTFVFKAENILYGSFGDLQGAGFTDKVIWLNYYRVAPFLLVVLIVCASVFVAKKKKKAAVRTLLIYPAFWLLVSALALIVQSFVVSPNEVLKESKSIADNIEYTQAAYGLNNVSEVVFDVENNLKAEELKKNENITENIRIVDLSANLTALNQIQGIRNYYKFNDTDILPYEIEGKKTAVAITAREITKENLSDSADTYINRTLRYTHGFGVAMNAINRVSAQGQPELFIKDIPPKSSDGIQNITQPRIYYGELTDDYVVVGNKKYKELDYSEGQEDIEFSYDGTGGLKLSLFNRALFAFKYGDIRLAISDLVSRESRILINRNILDRVRIAAPFLIYDEDPSIVIDDDGSLKWIIDAYTTTSYYPYSQSHGNFNYIRNSVKAVVDAYNGDVTFYIIDKEDPVVMSYKSIYPDLFSKDDMPKGLKKYSKYPEFLFGIQSAAYGRYHVSNPTAFYNKNDMWVIAKERYGTSTEEKQIAAYYNMMRLDNEEEEELLMTIPYTLINKDNMVAWFAVRNEAENYGKLQIYKFPKDINVYGPMQIENRINAHAEISQELNLWSQGGSKVIRGNMIVVPINNSILYVEPIYIASSNQSTLPELKQVVVAYNEKIVMKSSLGEALYALFGESVPDDEDNEIIFDEGLSYESVAQKVIDEFRRVKESSQNNDWSMFGNSMSELEKRINELEKSIKTE